MFPIRTRKIDISVRQTYRWKARFVGFLRYVCFCATVPQLSELWFGVVRVFYLQFQDQRWGL